MYKQPKHHVALGLPAARTQLYSWSCLPGPELALGHACECPVKAPPGAWTATKRKQAKHHVALALPAFRGEPKRHVFQQGFFHSNSSFLNLLIMIIIFILL